MQYEYRVYHNKAIEWTANFDGRFSLNHAFSRIWGHKKNGNVGFCPKVAATSGDLGSNSSKMQPNSPFMEEQECWIARFGSLSQLHQGVGDLWVPGGPSQRLQVLIPTRWCRSVLHIGGPQPHMRTKMSSSASKWVHFRQNQSNSYVLRRRSLRPQPSAVI